MFKEENKAIYQKRFIYRSVDSDTINQIKIYEIYACLKSNSKKHLRKDKSNYYLFILCIIQFILYIFININLLYNYYSFYNLFKIIFFFI